MEIHSQVFGTLELKVTTLNISQLLNAKQHSQGLHNYDTI